MLKRLTFLHIVFVVFLSTTISAEYARADGKYNIKVRVNEDIITNYDIEQRKKIYSLLKIPTFDNQNSIIEDLINNKIQTQYAQSLKVSLSNEEIKLEVKNFLNERKVDQTVLLRILEQNGISWLSFKKYISEGKIWKKAVLKSFQRNANISDNKLNSSFVKSSYSYVSKVSLSEIVIPFAERGKQRTLLLAERLYLELNEGSSFEKAAKRFSRSKSVNQKGNLGVVQESKLPSNIKEIISLMSPNQVSKPVVIGENVALFKLNSRVETKQAPKGHDPIITFKKILAKNYDQEEICSDKNFKLEGPILLSKLSSKLSETLRLSTLFEPAFINENLWVVLCSKKYNFDKQTEIKLKNAFLDSEISDYAKALMLEIQKKALVLHNE